MTSPTVFVTGKYERDPTVLASIIMDATELAIHCKTSEGLLVARTGRAGMIG
jgi:hypothetical protein